jgi:hypothetical protein
MIELTTRRELPGKSVAICTVTWHIVLHAIIGYVSYAYASKLAKPTRLQLTYVMACLLPLPLSKWHSKQLCVVSSNSCARYMPCNKLNSCADSTVRTSDRCCTLTKNKRRQRLHACPACRQSPVQPLVAQLPAKGRARRCENIYS